MIRNIKRRYFEIWGSEESQNIILKGFVLGLSILVLLLAIALGVLACRKPELIAVGDQATTVLKVKEPGEAILHAELERVVREYVVMHYTWNSSTIEAAHEKASRYIAPAFRSSFMKTNAEQVRFVKEKKVSQRVYLSEPPVIDAKKLSARVRLDRVYQIEGLSGSAPFTLDLAFDYGPRTETNPEGVYITDEKLVQTVEAK
jgi:hypothetical protein